MILNLSKPMTVVTPDGNFDFADTDPAEMDPAGLSCVRREDNKVFFFPWGSVARIEQELVV